MRYILFNRKEVEEMDQKPLLPTNDYVFKKVFGENLAILGNFLKETHSVLYGEVIGGTGQKRR
jgi:hypothetical protein